MKKTVFHHSFCSQLFLLLFLLFLSGFLFLSNPVSVHAASRYPLSITDCSLKTSSKIQILAERTKNTQLPSGTCYLFSLPLSRSSVSDSAIPLASRKIAGRMKFSFPCHAKSSDSRLNTSYLLAIRRKDGSYTPISNRVFVTNPQKLASVTSRFPKAVSKKGLQTCASMPEDAAELNVRNAAINISFTELLPTAAEKNASACISYRYHGETWWFRKSSVFSYDKQLRALKESKSVNSAILLLGWRDDLTYLIYPSGREQGHAYYAWNTTSVKAREQLQACLSFLASRYSAPDSPNGRIVNWIVGNEVNNYQVYHYAGKKSLSKYARIYADNFRLTYNTICSVYSNARVYISLDHLWNTLTVYGTFPARKMLDAFASSLSAHGKIPWNLAYHPYSSPLTEPRFWANTNGQLTDSLSSPVINMGNITLLTDYIREKYGSGTRIILSEQGYTSVQASRNTEKEQAAAIAYSYYLTESNDMIDSFIMNRHVDHEAETAQGLNLGLWTTSASWSPEWASQKKFSWNVFKYMDTSRSQKTTSFALSELGVSSWKDVIPDYKKSKVQKYSVTRGKLQFINTWAPKKSLAHKWRSYGAVSSLVRKNSSVRIKHDNNRNRNALWGVRQTFPSHLRFQEASKFCMNCQITGATRSTAVLKLRFFSHNNIREYSACVPVGQKLSLTADLQQWKYSNEVTKIEVLLAPSGDGNWNSNASFEMSYPACS